LIEVFWVCVVVIVSPQKGHFIWSLPALKPVNCPTTTDFSILYARHLGFRHSAAIFICVYCSFSPATGYLPHQFLQPVLKHQFSRTLGTAVEPVLKFAHCYFVRRRRHLDGDGQTSCQPRIRIRESTAPELDQRQCRSLV
jgi:hypothetical protein